MYCIDCEHGPVSCRQYLPLYETYSTPYCQNFSLCKMFTSGLETSEARLDRARNSFWKKKEKE